MGTRSASNRILLVVTADVSGSQPSKQPVTSSCTYPTVWSATNLTYTESVRIASDGDCEDVIRQRRRWAVIRPLTFQAVNRIGQRVPCGSSLLLLCCSGSDRSPLLLLLLLRNKLLLFDVAGKRGFPLCEWQMTLGGVVYSCYSCEWHHHDHFRESTLAPVSVSAPVAVLR